MLDTAGFLQNPRGLPGWKNRSPLRGRSAARLRLEKVEGPWLACDADVHSHLPALDRRRCACFPARRARDVGTPRRNASGYLEPQRFIVNRGPQRNRRERAGPSRSAERRAMLVNVVDVPALCNLSCPAIVPARARWPSRSPKKKKKKKKKNQKKKNRRAPAPRRFGQAHETARSASLLLALAPS